MKEAIINVLAAWPAELATAILAALPITELRGSIPIAISFFHLEPFSALLWSLLGNAVPVFAIVFLLPPAAAVCDKRLPTCHRALQWIFKRTAKKFEGKYEKYGALALFLFVSIPLPLTGVWTGAIAAYLFQISKKIAIPALLAGMLTAGILVTLISTGVIGALKFIL